MNKFFEWGIIFTLFILSINVFATTFGASGSLSVVGASLKTSDVNVSISDINSQLVQQTTQAIKSGSPFDQIITYVSQISGGVALVFTQVIGFVTAYAQILYQILPPALHPLVIIIIIVLTTIQALTILYLLLTVLSVLRGGGVS